MPTLPVLSLDPQLVPRLGKHVSESQGRPCHRGRHCQSSAYLMNHSILNSRAPAPSGGRSPSEVGGGGKCQGA